MADTAIRSELHEHFHDVPGFSDAFLNSCLRICKDYNVSGEDLFYKWEASTFNMDRIIDDKTTSNIEAAVKASLVKAKKQLTQDQIRHAGSSRGRPGMDPFFVKRSAMQVGTVASSSPMRSLRQPTGIRNTTDRRFKVNLEVTDTDMQKTEYKYMYEKISDRSEALDERIDEFGELIKKHYGLSELGDPGLTTDADITAVGRIVLDAESSSSGSVKLNEASICLESSRMMGAGTRIPVRFEPSVKIRGAPRGQGAIGLFPGAIVAFKGRNGGAGWFSVSEILSLPPLSPPSKAMNQPLKTDPLDESSFSMIIACGPYTLDTDLSFKPWKSLVEKVRVERPDVLLLLGPFLDCHHPKLRTGDIDGFPDDIFKNIYTQDLLDLVSGSSPSPLILLLPSVRDVQSDHAVYPQRPLQADLFDSTNIKMLQNPARFSINGVHFAATSVDTLFHLKKEEFIKRADEIDSTTVSAASSATDAMSNLCRHLFYQRSFYPVFPTPLDVVQETNLDISHIKGLDICSRTESAAPDILIVPSRLKHFAKNVDDTIAINPSYASKSVFASLFYSGSGDGSASMRCKITIDKI